MQKRLSRLSLLFVLAAAVSLPLSSRSNGVPWWESDCYKRWPEIKKKLESLSVTLTNYCQGDTFDPPEGNASDPVTLPCLPGCWLKVRFTIDYTLPNKGGFGAVVVFPYAALYSHWPDTGIDDC